MNWYKKAINELENLNKSLLLLGITDMRLNISYKTPQEIHNDPEPQSNPLVHEQNFPIRSMGSALRWRLYANGIFVWEIVEKNIEHANGLIKYTVRFLKDKGYQINKTIEMLDYMPTEE